MKKDKSKFKLYLKTLLLFLIGTVLIMQTGFILRKIIIGKVSVSEPTSQTVITNISSKKAANAETKTYLKLLETTPLYSSTKQNESDCIMFLLPKTYYAEIIGKTKLFSGADAYEVRYNGFTGFAKVSAFDTKTSASGVMQDGITISLTKDAGTYIRTSPKITNNIIKVINIGETNINFIGTVEGDVPSDGNSNIWYFCTYYASDTKAYLGYIYSERCILSSPLTDYREPSEITNESTLPTSASGSQDSLSPKTNMTKGLMWFVIILFSVPTLIVFVLLIKKPKRKQTINENAPDAEFTTNKATLPLSAEEQVPEFLDLVGAPTGSFARRAKKIKTHDVNELSPFLSFKVPTETNQEYQTNYNNVSGGTENDNSGRKPPKFHLFRNQKTENDVRQPNPYQNATYGNNFETFTTNNPTNSNGLGLNSANNQTGYNSFAPNNYNDGNYPPKTNAQNTTPPINSNKPTKKEGFFSKLFNVSPTDTIKNDIKNNTLMCGRTTNNGSREREVGAKITNSKSQNPNTFATNFRYDAAERIVRRRHLAAKNQKELDRRRNENRKRDQKSEQTQGDSFKFFSGNNCCFFVENNSAHQEIRARNKKKIMDEKPTLLSDFYSSDTIESEFSKELSPNQIGTDAHNNFWAKNHFNGTKNFSQK